VEYGMMSRGARMVVVLGYTENFAARRTPSKPTLDVDRPGAAGPGAMPTIPATTGSLQLKSSSEQQEAVVMQGVLDLMQRLLAASDRLRGAVADGDVFLVGALSNTFQGDLRWLGPHPQQGKLAKPRSVLPTDPISSITNSPNEASEQLEVLGKCSLDGRTVLRRLEEGNAAYLQAAITDIYLAGGETSDGHEVEPSSAALSNGRNGASLRTVAAPSAVVLAGAFAEISAPELILNTAPGELLVQRTPGAVCGRQGGDLQACLQLLVEESEAPLLLVMGDTRCPALATALRQAQDASGSHRYRAAQSALDQLLPSALLALKEYAERPPLPPREDSLGSVASIRSHLFEDNVISPRSMISARSVASMSLAPPRSFLPEELRRVAASHAVRYSMQRLLLDCPVIAQRCREGKLEVQGAVTDTADRVHFLGPPEDLPQLLRREATMKRRMRVAR